MTLFSRDTDVQALGAQSPRLAETFMSPTNSARSGKTSLNSANSNAEQPQQVDQQVQQTEPLRFARSTWEQLNRNEPCSASTSRDRQAPIIVRIDHAILPVKRFREAGWNFPTTESLGLAGKCSDAD
jgi:hypothetical protein